MVDHSVRALVMLLMLGGCRSATSPRLSGGDAADADGNATDGKAIDAASPDAPAFTAGPSCVGLASTCGPNGDQSCCTSPLVPGNAIGATLAGASFFRSYDVAADGMYADMSYPATVSDFRLDTYLVTVGRFRAFVNAGLGTQASPPASGAGERTLNGMANQGGWDPSFDASLKLNDLEFVDYSLNCEDPNEHQTWTDTPGSHENLPMNCVDWYEAMAFCAWDGGFLPTEAEWNYAASGGSEQRAYPWSSPAASTTIDCSYANNSGCTNPPIGVPNHVGSESPKGDGMWGQSDLGGNVSEWVLDWYASPYPTTACDDCANLTAATARVVRGGSFPIAAPGLRAAFRTYWTPTDRGYEVGFRCARTP